jgi:serine/threonine protein kinase
VLRALATGGMGEVLLAKAPDQARPVVIKRVLPHLAHDASFRALFFAEAGVVARLQHPNIARILELGDAQGQPYLVLEFVEGLTLAALVEKQQSPLGGDAVGEKKQGALSVDQACRIGGDVAAALHHAHTARDSQGRALGVLHRDVSVRNVMVGVDGVVKLIDFGLARAEEGGAVAYRAPDEVLDARSDQFSLGLVLWELLTGRPRFDGDDDAAILHQLAECAPRSLGQGFPPALDAIVARMLSKAPVDRFADCGDVAQALADFAGTVPALAALVAPYAGPLVETNATSSSVDREARFVARAKLVDRAFVMTEPLRAVLASLDSERSLRLVAGQVPRVPPSTSLPAIAAWSWASLAVHEQFSLQRLVDHAGDFTIDFAEATLDLSGFPGAPWPLDVVQALAFRGWLETHDTEQGPQFSIPAELRAFVVR